MNPNIHEKEFFAQLLPRSISWLPLIVKRRLRNLEPEEDELKGEAFASSKGKRRKIPSLAEKEESPRKIVRYSKCLSANPC
jgi:hypothetical protein